MFKLMLGLSSYTESITVTDERLATIEFWERFPS